MSQRTQETWVEDRKAWTESKDLEEGCQEEGGLNQGKTTKSKGLGTNRALEQKLLREKVSSSYSP